MRRMMELNDITIIHGTILEFEPVLTIVASKDYTIKEVI
jgi:hypothetical protein